MKGSDPSTALHHNSILQCKEKAEEEENGDNDSSTEDEFREEKVKSGERTHDGDDGSSDDNGSAIREWCPGFRGALKIMAVNVTNLV